MEAQHYITELIGAKVRQVEIAQAIGLGQSTVSKVYRGQIDDIGSKPYRLLQELHAKRVKKAKPKRQSR